MDESHAPWVIRNFLGEFLQQLAFVDRRWIHVDSCTNNCFIPKGKIEEIKCPIDSFCDILGVSAKWANDYLCAIKLLTPHNVNKNMLCINQKVWNRLKSEFCLDVELVPVKDINYLCSKNVWVFRVGCLSENNHNTTFDAKQQARRFLAGEGDFHAGWQPKRLWATSQANSFVCNTAFAFSILKANKESEQR
jgi:hypothetical protein